MLIACLVAESMMFWTCRPSVTLHQGQGHQNEHGHIGHPQVYRHAKFEYNSLHVLSEILQVKSSQV